MWYFPFAQAKTACAYMYRVFKKQEIVSAEAAATIHNISVLFLSEKLVRNTSKNL